MTVREEHSKYNFFLLLLFNGTQHADSWHSSKIFFKIFFNYILFSTKNTLLCKPPNILHLKVNKITNSLFFSFFRVELLALLH